METRKSLVYWVMFTLILVSSISTSSLLASTKYPTKAVSFIVTFPPGGRTDLNARIVAEFLKNYLGQPLVVVNKPGASGVAGAKEVAMAAPDGYTLGFFSRSNLQSQYGVPTPANFKEYEYIALVNMDPTFLAVSLKSNTNSVKELVAYCKKNPEKFIFAVTPGASADIDAAAFAKAAGVKVRYMPFRGGGERKQALAGGHVDGSFDVLGTYKPLADAGIIKILGVAAENRLSSYPDIPTLKEQGVDLVISSWHGVFAPKNTPADILKILEIALEKTAKDPGFISLMQKSHLGVTYMNRSDFTNFLQKEDKEVKRLVEELGEIAY